MFVGLNDRLATLKDAEQIDIDLVNAEKLPVFIYINIGAKKIKNI